MVKVIELNWINGTSSGHYLYSKEGQIHFERPNRPSEHFVGFSNHGEAAFFIEPGVSDTREGFEADNVRLFSRSSIGETVQSLLKVQFGLYFKA